MNLNHLNLTVRDLPLVRDFFIKNLGFVAAEPKPNDSLSVMKGGNNFTLVMMSDRMNEKGNNLYPDAFHFGFFLDSREAVNSKYEELKTDGRAVLQEPAEIRKSFGFYFHLDRLLVEISVPNSDPVN
jgi:lactoylglutathione lyase